MGKPVIVSTVQEAQDLLHFCLEGGGEIISGKHFRDELMAEGLTFEDAWVVLKTGLIYDPPEPDIRTGEVKYRVEGYEPDGKWIAIVFSFKALTRAFLITIFSVKGKGRSI
jgi:hypothetical protein